MIDQVAIAQVPAADWDRAEREARRAAGYVAMFVGVPAVVAAGAALVIFALTWLVLLAPLVAAVLTWMAWRYGRPDPSELRPSVIGPRSEGPPCVRRPGC